MRVKKVFIFLLVILFAVLPALVSCQNEKPKKSQVSVERTDEYGRPYIEDNVPDDLDFGGETLYVLVRSDDLHVMEFGVEETNGSILNDSLYTRNSRVEEALNIKIKTIIHYPPAGTVWASNDFNEAVRAAILGGTNDFDIIASYAYYGVALANEGLLKNLINVPYLDFSKPWWNQDFISEMTINDKLYFVIGDASFSSIDYTFATFYNKDLAKKWFPEIDFYKVVDDGDWTLDYLNQLVKNIYDDKDGSGDRSNGDFYGIGIATASTPIDALFAGANIPITSKNSEGLPYFTFMSERTIQFFDKMYDLLFNNQGVLPGQYTFDSIDLMEKKFRNQETIFNITKLNTVNTYTDVDFEYGLLPIPKLDKEQEDYYTCAYDASSFLSIPVTEPEDRLEMVGAALELLAAESYRTVTPAYFEVIMKYRYLRTNEDARMYDKVLAGVRFNFGVVYSYNLNNIQHLVREVLNNRSKDFVSAYEARIDAAEYNLEKLIEFYLEDNDT
ncbi:MAG TPA: extracellular solute-binding protein [Bacillota bacterium]|nr:extracellular solute-binding protein [Bacillota bacterium]